MVKGKAARWSVAPLLKVSAPDAGRSELVWAVRLNHRILEVPIGFDQKVLRDFGRLELGQIVVPRQDCLGDLLKFLLLVHRILSASSAA